MAAGRAAADGIREHKRLPLRCVGLFQHRNLASLRRICGEEAMNSGELWSKVKDIPLNTQQHGSELSMSHRTSRRNSMLTAPYRWCLMLGACVSLTLGFIGVVVPGMPTTVFVLIAAWLAARSSPSLALWLDNHKVTGPIIHHWRNGRCMPRSAKYAATAGMSLSAVIMAVTATPVWVMAGTDIMMLCVLIWLWRLPEPELPDGKA